MNCTMENIFGARTEELKSRYLAKGSGIGGFKLDGPKFATKTSIPSTTKTHNVGAFDPDGIDAQTPCTHMAPETVVARWIRRGGDTLTGGGGVLFGGGPLPGGEIPPSDASRFAPPELSPKHKPVALNGGPKQLHTRSWSYLIST